MNSQDQTLAGMRAEVGYGEDEIVEPVRISGFLSLICGLLSVTTFMATPLLIFSVLAVVFGFVALRRHQGAVPPGTRVAKIGMVLAIGFAAFGIGVTQLKAMTLRTQAKQFSLDYLNLVARGDSMLARELNKSFAIRLPPTMSLADHYAANPKAAESLATFHYRPVHVDVRRIGPNADWKLLKPIRINYHYGREEADVVWVGPSGDEKVQFFLEFQFDPEGVGQWHVETIQGYRERVVAERVL